MRGGGGANNFFKLSLKTTLGDVRTQNNLDLEILKKKSALLDLENDCSSSCHFFKLLF